MLASLFLSLGNDLQRNSNEHAEIINREQTL